MYINALDKRMNILIKFKRIIFLEYFAYTLYKIGDDFLLHRDNI